MALKFTKFMNDYRRYLVWKILRYLKPKVFFIGVLGSFLACCVLGHYVSQKAYFRHFVRSYNSISPEAQYFPTASELLMTAEHYFNPNKISVLVGGNSIFRGVGQNADTLWTNELQKRLGSDYQVLNLANNGATPGAYSGVVMRMLVERYPKLIYITTCGMGSGSMEGTEVYRYLLWDAYYKHLFHPDSSEKKIIFQLRHQELRTAAGLEMHLLAYLDSWLYFRNFWNWVGYNYFFTVWNYLANNPPFRGRRYSHDDIIDFNQIKKIAATKDNIAYIGALNTIDGLHKQLPAFFNKDHTHVAEGIKQVTLDAYTQLYSPRYRSKILCVWIPYDPLYSNNLPKNERRMYKTMTSELSSSMEQVGYHSIDIQDLKESDYVDVLHLLASGGNKVAKEISPKILQISREEDVLARSTDNRSIR